MTTTYATAHDLAGEIITEAKEQGTGTILAVKIHNENGDYLYNVTADQARRVVAGHLKDGDAIRVWYFNPDAE